MSFFKGGQITKKRVCALIAVEMVFLALALVYGRAVLGGHSNLAVAVYVAFWALFLALNALLWYLFVVCRLRVGAVEATPRRLGAVAGVSLCAALLLEAGTLVGAPLSSPFVLSDWHFSRIAAFAFMALPLNAWLSLRDWKAACDKVARLVRERPSDWLRRLLLRVAPYALAVACAAALAFAACAFSGKSDASAYMLCASVLALVATALVRMRGSFAEHPEKPFVVVLLGAGFVLCALVPLYTHVSWDDHIHYDRTVAVSYLLDPQYDPSDVALVERDYNDVANYSRAEKGPGWVDPYSEENLGGAYRDLDDKGQHRDDAQPRKGATTWRNVGIIEYYVVAYIPAACALWLARLLSLPVVAALFLGKLATLLTCAALTYAACKRLKSGKMILITCALIPTTVFLASNYSYDFWLTSFVMLGFAYFIGEMQRPDEQLTWRNLIIMIAAFLLGFGPKAIYVPIAAMLLFMPKSKFGGQVSRRLYLAIVFASAAFVLATFVAPFFFAGPGEGDARGGDVNPGMQMAFITQQPLAYLQVFWNFLNDYLALRNSEFIFTDMCGVETASFERLIAVLLPIVALTDRRLCDAGLATHAKRLCMLGLSLLTMFLIATALYISFTPGGAMYIAGVQGRYLLPMLFPLFAICLNFRPIQKCCDNANWGVYNAGVLLLSAFLLYASIAEVLVFKF